MLYFFAVVFFLLWSAGIFWDYMMGGFINLFLAISILLVLLRVIGGRNYREYFTGARLKNLHNELPINTTVSIILLIVGIVMLFEGIHGMDVMNTDISQFFINAQTHNVIWMLVAGVVGTSIGSVGVFSGRHKEAKHI